MWPFKKNIFKIRREEVVACLIDLNNKEAKIEEDILKNKNKISELMESGQKEKDRDLRLFYAKKISYLKQENLSLIQRGMYVLYNQKMLNKLKDAMDDKDFYNSTNKINLSSLLSDQKNLAKYLNQVLNTKIKSEEIMTSADDVFNEVANSYEPNEAIYGINSNDDELLSMFELGSFASEDSNRVDVTEKEGEKNEIKE